MKNDEIFLELVQKTPYFKLISVFENWVPFMSVDVH